MDQEQDGKNQQGIEDSMATASETAFVLHAARWRNDERRESGQETMAQHVDTLIR